MIEPWPHQCGSIGYEGRSLPEFCQALRESGVEVLIDVRARAWSHRPEYRKTALSQALRQGEIQYIHFKAAGNPFRPRKGDERGREACEALFREHLSENPEILSQLAELAEGSRVALFCYEASARECHRGVILEHFSGSGGELRVIEL